MRDKTSTPIPSPITNQITIHKDRALVFPSHDAFVMKFIVLGIFTNTILNQLHKIVRQELV